MIDWVDAWCKDWGNQRALLAAHVVQPLPSIFGKILDEGMFAAGSGGRPNQPTHAALTGNALKIHVAIQRAIEARRFTERMYLVMAAHYIAGGKMAWKAKVLGLSQVGYYRMLHKIHVRLTRFMDDPEPTNV